MNRFTIARPKVLALALTVVLGLPLTWMALAPSTQAQQAAQPAAPEGSAALSVSLVQPERIRLSYSLSANGSVAAWQESVVGHETQGLRLIDLRADVGDVVRKGQVLAVFAADTLRAEQAQIRAALAEAESALAQARADADRARSLQGEGALSAQQIDQLLRAEQSAQARVEAQRAAARLQQVRLAQTEVRAPDDGIVSSRLATLGAVPAPGQELFRLIRQSRLEWLGEVPSHDLGRLAAGQTVRVVGPDGSEVAGVVRQVAPTVDARTRLGLVQVDLPEPGNLKPGMFARGNFELGESEALTLPNTAVLLRDGFSYVMAVDAQSRIVETKVQTGRRSGDRVEIVDGLAADAQVVLTGGAFLADGDTVRVVSATPSNR